MSSAGGRSLNERSTYDDGDAGDGNAAAGDEADDEDETGRHP